MFRPVIQKACAVPSSTFSGKHRKFDHPFVSADQHILILTYRGVPDRKQSSAFDSVIMVQALGYRQYRFVPKARLQATPSVTVMQRNGNSVLRIRFQAATFEAVAKEFRTYAFVDDNVRGEDVIEIDPESLIFQRDYFERQLDSEAHYPIWDKLLNSGRTREDLWMELQEKYLFKYRRFLRVECDWGSTGIWKISFPGAYAASPNYDYSHFDLPKTLLRRFDRWTRYYNSMEPGVPFDQQGFDKEWFDREGAVLAEELAARVDPLTYVEYHPFVQAKGNRGHASRAFC